MLIVRVYDANGEEVYCQVGPSDQELEANHLAGQCHAFCSYCYTEACEWAETNAVSSDLADPSAPNKAG